jgi:hypothetical protein
MRILNAVFFISLLSLSALLMGPTPAFAAHAYEMTIVPPTTALAFPIYRIDPATGVVASSNGSGYLPTSDPSALPRGDYHLRYVQSVDGKNYWLYRMDSQTGRTWSLVGTAWAPMQEPK